MESCHSVRTAVPERDFSIKQGEIKEQAKQSKRKEKNEESTKYM
jgi:hypothetical protein